MKRLSPDQQGVVRNGAFGVAVAVAVAAGLPAYLWLPDDWAGVHGLTRAADRIAFALKWDILVLLWLAGCVRQVSRGRFNSPADIGGSAFSPPSPAIAVTRAVLQNSLEQTVLVVGAHLTLAVTLRGRELVLIPVLVGLFLVGRIWFALGYKQGAPRRAGGMVLTSAPTFAALFLTGALALAGR